ncbi:MAG: hypothetical protein PVF83_01675 [Anaerolineales bacterium]
MSKKRLKVEHEQDQIWISKEQLFKGIMAQIVAFDPKQTRVVLVAHFPSTFRHLESLLQSTSLAYETYPTPLDARRLAAIREYETPFKVMLVLASVLPLEVREENTILAASEIEVELIVAEHHPLPAQDDIVIEFAKKLPYNCRLIFHETLDSTLMKFYGGDNMQQMMSSLKMPDNQPISGPLIDNMIHKAQKKIAKRVTQPLMADSAEQWFQLNIVDND